MKSISSNKQSGAVSLFVVIFAMLLITVVTVSFLRIMMNDQRQASDNDLSQSAYDSAQAGVEDAKRALLIYQQQCSSEPGRCSEFAKEIVTDECNVGLKAVTGATANEEIPVQQTLGDAVLQQSYTCVKIQLETDDYVGDLSTNESQLVPLFPQDGATFNRVGIEWFSKDDLSISNVGGVVDLLGVVAGNKPLYSPGWPINRPPLLRAQLIQFANNFTLDSFDGVNGSQSNSGTMFLYPTSEPSIPEKSITGTDFRKTGPTDDPDKKLAGSTPTAISCTPTLGSGGFSCSTVLVLPEAIGATSGTDRTAFLRLQALYNATHFRVTLWNQEVDINSPAIPPQKFKDVQPVIDSTGRANDLFKRVESRVDLFDTSFPYPEATVDITGNFCKDFAITNDQYITGASGCTP